MNSMELIALVSQRSGVNAEDCQKVLNSFEEVFAQGLSEKRWKGRLFNRACKIMNNIQNRKTTIK